MPDSTHETNVLLPPRLHTKDSGHIVPDESNVQQGEADCPDCTTASHHMSRVKEARDEYRNDKQNPECTAFAVDMQKIIFLLSFCIILYRD